MDEELVESLVKPSLLSSKLMYSLVNDILDFYQLQEGKFVYSYTEFNLFTLLKEVHDLMGFNIKSKGVQFILEYNQGPMKIE